MQEHMAGEQARLRSGAPDISEWTLVLFGARSLLGLIDRPEGREGYFHLKPAYTVERTPQQIAPGKMAIVNVVAPILWHVSQPSVWIHMQAAILISVKALSKGEQNDWAAAVLQCDERTTAMRAHDAGIQVVGAGALSGIPKPGH